MTCQYPNSAQNFILKKLSDHRKTLLRCNHRISRHRHEARTLTKKEDVMGAYAFIRCDHKFVKYLQADIARLEKDLCFLGEPITVNV